MHLGAMPQHSLPPRVVCINSPRSLDVLASNHSVQLASSGTKNSRWSPFLACENGPVSPFAPGLSGHCPHLGRLICLFSLLLAWEVRPRTRPSLGSPLHRTKIRARKSTWSSNLASLKDECRHRHLAHSCPPPLLRMAIDT